MPKKYCVPSWAVTFQYWPWLAPLDAPVSSSTREPSSSFSRHVPELSSLPSSLARPSSDRNALSPSQHRSPVLLAGVLISSAHALYFRSIEPPPVRSKPSPTWDVCEFVCAVSPSLVPDEEASPPDRAPPPLAGGARDGKAHRKTP